MGHLAERVRRISKDIRLNDVGSWTDAALWTVIGETDWLTLEALGLEDHEVLAIREGRFDDVGDHALRAVIEGKSVKQIRLSLTTSKSPPADSHLGAGL